MQPVANWSSVFGYNNFHMS
jgi:hypothetical protein